VHGYGQDTKREMKIPTLGVAFLCGHAEGQMDEHSRHSSLCKLA